MRKRLVMFVVLAAIGLLATGSVATAKQTTVTLTARLSGAQEVPAADPDGSGKAFVMIDVEAGEVCFDIKSLSDVGTPNRGHIHVGGAGVNGDIVMPFFELRIPPTTPGSAPTDPRNDALENGRLADCVPGDPAVLAQIVANPANYYVNVHNARFPGGALRCQLET
jgi:CHRD domain-containing protein